MINCIYIFALLFCARIHKNIYDTHTRIHIYRAIIEGINFALMDGIERIENKTKTPITRVIVAGGGSQSGEILDEAGI